MLRGAYERMKYKLFVSTAVLISVLGSATVLGGATVYADTTKSWHLSPENLVSATMEIPQKQTATEKSNEGFEDPLSNEQLRRNCGVDAPTVNAFYEDQSIITGKTNSRQAVEVTVSIGRVNHMRVIKPNGSFVVDLGKKYPKGTSFTVYTTDAKWNKSKVYYGKVLGPSPVVLPLEVNPLYANQNVLTGTAQRDTTIHVFINEDVYVAYVKKNGEFSVTLDTTYEEGTTLFVYATDDANHMSHDYYGKVLGAVLETPIVNPLYSNQKVVTGTAEPNTTIYLTIAGDRYSGIVGANGEFSITLNRNYSNGAAIEAHIVNSNGDVSEKYTGTVLGGSVVVLEKPRVNALYANQKVISGTAIPNTTIYVNIAGESYSGLVGANGQFSIPLNKTYGEGSSVSAYVVDAAGHMSEIYSSTVLGGGTITLATPIVNELSANQKVISGTAVPNTTIYVTIAGESYTDVVGADGQFSITLNKTYAAGAAITAHVVDAKGNVSQDYNGTVLANTAINKPVANAFSDKDTVMTGTADPGATVYIAMEGSSIGYTALANASGNWSCNMMRNFAAGTPFSYYAKLGSATSETVNSNVQYTEKLAVNQLFTNGTNIRGKAAPNSTISVMVLDTRNIELTGVADANGYFDISLQGLRFPAGQVVTVTATDPAGGIQTKPIQVNPMDPQVNTIYAGATEITGLVDPKAEVIIKVNGIKFTTTADEEGNFVRPLVGLTLTSGMQVEVFQTSNNIDSNVITTSVV